MKTRFHWPSGTPHLGQITSQLFRWQRQAKLILAGGRWSAQLGPRTRRSLRWLAVDGVLANIGEAIYKCSLVY